MLELTDETMPFWFGGYLYVDSRIFNKLELSYGTMFYSRNISKQTVALYSTQNIRSMVFYIETGVTIDGTGRNYRAPAILKGDVVFVPISIVANFFDLNYATIPVNHGSLVRITADQAPILSDTEFVNAAADWIEVRYSEYLKTQSSTTTTTPSTTLPPQQSNSQTIHLAFAVSAQSNVDSWVSLLNQAKGQATFFFTSETILGQGDLLRQLQSQGHQIALMADGSLETPIVEQLTQANDTLYQATTSITRLVWLENASEEQTLAVSQAGYCPVSSQVDVSQAGLLTANGATATMAYIDEFDNNVTVWLGDSTSSTGLSALLSSASQSNDQFRVLTELLTA